MPRFLLLTTSIVGEDLTKLQRMVDSLREYHQTSDIEIDHILLLQKTSTQQAKIVAQTLNVPAWTHILNDERMLSLSVARNIMLDYADGLSAVSSDETTIVAFPDDDCWYPEGLLCHIAASFATQQCSFMFCRYGTQAAAVKQDSVRPKVAEYRDLVFNASSNTLFIDYAVVRQVGRFNENLGVGARFNGGEDLDYAVRAYRIADKTVWSPEILVGHRDKINDLRGTYYIGSALVLRGNASYSLSATLQFVRKLAIGVYLILKGEMPFGHLITALSARYKEPTHGTQKS